jgi:hypothetical protein
MQGSTWMTGDIDINSDPMGGYMALLTTPPPDSTQQSQTDNQEVESTQYYRAALTGMDGRRLRHEDHHVLRAVDDLCDLCIFVS